jgi:hypothetical protein
MPVTSRQASRGRRRNVVATGYRSARSDRPWLEVLDVISVPRSLAAPSGKTYGTNLAVSGSTLLSTRFGPADGRLSTSCAPLWTERGQPHSNAPEPSGPHHWDRIAGTLPSAGAERREPLERDVALGILAPRVNGTRSPWRDAPRRAGLSWGENVHEMPRDFAHLPPAARNRSEERSLLVRFTRRTRTCTVSSSPRQIEALCAGQPPRANISIFGRCSVAAARRSE